MGFRAQGKERRMNPQAPLGGWSEQDPDGWKRSQKFEGGDVEVGRVQPPEPTLGHQPPAPARERILGGGERRPGPVSAGQREPLLTLNSAPKLFGWAIPLCVVAGFIAVWAVRGYDPFWATFAGIAVAALGFVGTFVFAQRRRIDPMRAHGPDVSGPH